MSHFTLNNLERKYQIYLNNPDLAPKYKLWQTVKIEGCLKGDFWDGRICGSYFTRVSVAIYENCEPGWRYHIETGEEITIVHEDDILSVVEDDCTCDRQSANQSA